MVEDFTQEFVQLLLEASDNALDAKMKPLIEKWSQPPSAIQVLEVLDYCVNGGLASNLIINCLQILYYDFALKRENTTHQDVVKQALWRNI